MPIPVIKDDATSRQLNEALTASMAEVIQLRAKGPELSDSERTDLADHVRFIKDIDPLAQVAERLERAAVVPESNGPTTAFDAPADNHARTLGELVVANKDMLEFTRSGRSGTGSFQITIENTERALLAESDTTGNPSLWIPREQLGLPVLNTRRLWLRDILSRITTQGNGFSYMQEKTPATFETGATVVVEGAAKPEVTMQFQQKDAPIRKIAAWIPLTTEIIEDAPALRGYIDNRLIYMLNLREEVEFLAGDGTGAHILGIRAQTGLQTQAAVAGDVPATLASAIGKIENVDSDADAVVMHPLDFWGAIASRHATQFDSGFGGNAPSLVPNLSWGLPVIRTRAIEQTAALVGAFRQSATVIDRSDAVIEVGNQHSDYFTTNKVAVRAEKRVGLAVEKPSGICECVIDLTA